MVQLPKDWYKDWRTWKSDEWRPSKLQHCWDQPEYFEESWRLEETRCLSISIGKPRCKKFSNNNNNNINNNNNNNGRGLASIEDSVDASIQRLEDYIQKHDGRLITAFRNDTENTMDNRMTITRKQKWEEKQLYGCFKQLINNISHDKTWTWLRKGNFKRETESPLIAAKINAVRTNHIKAKIDKTQQNNKCRLCGDRDEPINHISECRKWSLKEYKTRHHWVGKVIHWEMCKKFRFDHTNKWYMHNPAPVLENNTHKILWDFDIHTDHLISPRRTDPIIIYKKKKKKKKKKRTCKISDLAVPADYRIKLKECEKKDKYLDLARELKKLWNMQVTIIPIVIGAFEQ